MSSQVTTSFVEQYKSNVMTLVQQKGSRFRDAVVTDSAIVGKKTFVEQIGTTEAQVRTSRHADSPMVDSPHLRRSLTLTDYEWGDMIDNADRVRMLIDPTDAYAQNAAWAMSRAMDDVVVSAAFGTAYTGVTGSTSTVLPATQKVAVDMVAAGTTGGGTDKGLNLGKLRAAREILGSNEVDPDEQLYCALNANQLSNLLAITEVTSSDYNAVKALVNGELDTFLGFKFILSERLGTDGNDDQRVLCWAKSGLMLGLGKDVMAQIAPRADKSFSTYIYFCMTIGATRLEEKKVVEIACDPTNAG